MKRLRPGPLSALVLALGVTGALAGCSADNSPSSSSGSYSGAVAPAMPPGADSAGKQEAAPAAGNAKAQVGVQDRKLVRTAKVTLTSPDVAGTVGQARQIAVTAGGYTGAEQTSSDSASLTLSIPVDKLDASLEQLATLPKTTVTRREQSAQDVTDQTVDVEARLATQRASVERVRALLARATSVSEITSIEGELTSRESELESLERRRDALAGSVAMSTVSLNVSAVAAPRPPAEDKSGFVGGLSGGWDAFLTFGGGALTVLGALAPFLLVIVPVGAVLWWLRKRRAPVAAPAVTPEAD